MINCDGPNPVGLHNFPHRMGTTTVGKTGDSVNLILEKHLGSVAHQPFYCSKLILRDARSCETVAKFSIKVHKESYRVTLEVPSLGEWISRQPSNWICKCWDKLFQNLGNKAAFFCLLSALSGHLLQGITLTSASPDGSILIG